MLPLLPASEQRLVESWGAPPPTPPVTTYVHRLFEAQVARTPAAVAVICQGTALTYRQLDERANQLAHALRRLGVGPETLVGLCLPRSLELAVGVLGILKAGGAYLPLDAETPAARLGFLLRDARPRVLIVHTDIPALAAEIERLSGPGRPLMLTLDPEGLASQPTTRVPDVDPGADLNRLAYVVYTSGSTGTPKGVLVEHRALACRLLAAQAHYRYQPHDRVLQFAALSFDAATEELLTPWLSGAAVLLRPDAVLASFVELHRFIEAEQLTVLNLPTAYWHAWVEDLLQTGTPIPARVALVIVGGERVLPEWLRAWQTMAGSRVRWINAYGPTEATITATLYEAPATPRQLPGCPVPIGHPIAGTEAYVLDEHCRQVPIGVPGELYLGGDGLARGYLNAAALTAERFVPNPFVGPSRSPRVYRSGDRVRYRPDGHLEYLGRIDDQVKIRGVRVEPAEIEAVLSRYEPVQAAAVVAHTDARGEVDLIAYLVPRHPAASVDVAAVRRFLHQHLSTPMVPTAFVPLPTLPLLPSGKVDRRALPRPDGPTTTYQAPRTPVETQLVDLWTQVLRRERVGIHDDFFQLGGHSLLATQFLSRLRDRCGVELPLRQLFEQPTIAGLAPLIEQYRASGAAEQRPITPQTFDEAEQLLGRIDALSEAQVDALLKDLLANEGHGG
jgi:amino acid adenylation domain-containing protein